MNDQRAALLNQVREAAGESNLPAKIEKEVEKKKDRVHHLIKAWMPSIKSILPKHISAKRMARLIYTTIRRNQDLMECSDASLVGAMLTCTQLGLEPGPLGYAYLIPFRNTKLGTVECQFVVGYRGLVQLYYRSGMVTSVYASAVYENDHFICTRGMDGILEHKRAEGERGDLMGFFAYVTISLPSLTGSERKALVYEYMTKAEVNAVRDEFSQAFKTTGGGPWKDNYIAMAKKTVLKALDPWVPKATEAPVMEIEQYDGSIRTTADEVVPNFEVIEENGEKTESSPSHTQNDQVVTKNTTSARKSNPVITPKTDTSFGPPSSAGTPPPEEEVECTSCHQLYWASQIAYSRGRAKWCANCFKIKKAEKAAKARIASNSPEAPHSSNGAASVMAQNPSTEAKDAGEGAPKKSAPLSPTRTWRTFMEMQDEHYKVDFSHDDMQLIVECLERGKKMEDAIGAGDVVAAVKKIAGNRIHITELSTEEKIRLSAALA